MSNPVQNWMVNVLTPAVGTSDVIVQAELKEPPAQLPTKDTLLSVNGVPQTILPHPPVDYVWR